MDEQHATQQQVTERTVAPLPIRLGRQRLSPLMQTLVAVLLTALLLVLLTDCSTGPPGPSLPASRGWQAVSSPNPGLTQNGLYAVATVSANNVWAVGYSSNTPPNTSGVIYGQTFSGGQTLIEHWNGQQWSVVSSPNPGSTLNVLNAVAVVSANNIWAVGGFSNSNSNYTEQTLIEHWNGSKWSVVPSPSPGSIQNVLNAVAVVSSNDVWTVGYSTSRTSTYTAPGGTIYQFISQPTLIEHWNGIQWSVIKSPNLGVQNFGFPQNFLKGVAAISVNDIWAVGGFIDFTPPSTNTTQTLIEHWNGSKWSIVPSPSTGSFDKLNMVTVVSANDIWAVGGSFFFTSAQRGSQTLIEHWNGSKWSIVQSANNPVANNNFLNGVVAISANDAWAVGGSPRTYPLQGQALIEHWNGKQWSVISGSSPGLYNNFLTAVTRDPHSSRIWAAGAYGEGYTPERTITEVWSA